MGWCSATEIFDAVAGALLNEGPKKSPEEILKFLAEVLQDNDWDCELDSEYSNHPVVRKIFIELGVVED